MNKKKKQKSFSPFFGIVLFFLLLYFSIIYHTGMLKEDLIILRFEVTNVEQNSDEEFLIKDEKIVEIIIMHNINYKIESFKINEKKIIVEEKISDKEEGAYYNQKSEKYKIILVKYQISDNEEKLVLSEISFNRNNTIFLRNNFLYNENNKEIKIKIFKDGDLK